MNTFITLLTLNAGSAIAAVVGILFGAAGAIYCVMKARSSSTPPDRKPYWIGGIVVGLGMIVLGILVLAGVI